MSCSRSGLVAAAIAATRPLAALGCVALGGVIGGVLAGGWWSFLLWRDFGNPVFPLFNGIFPSPELSSVNILDRQFIPHGWLDGDAARPGFSRRHLSSTIP